MMDICQLQLTFQLRKEEKACILTSSPCWCDVTLGAVWLFPLRDFVSTPLRIMFTLS